MKISCVIMGHKWKGCKCERCGKQRDQEHDYRPCEGSCYKVCSICGRKKTPEFNDHKWNGCKCSVCGLVRNSGHEFHRVKGAKRYGVCGTKSASDQYACNWCTEKDCNHVELTPEADYYRCSICGKREGTEAVRKSRENKYFDS